MEQKEELKILPLSPERLGDFTDFFETGIPETEWGHRCYCAAFCGKDNCSETGMEKPEARKEAAVRYIGDGTMRGYLAYSGDRVVGWCSANDRNASRKCFGARFILGSELPETKEQGLSVFCFEIAPEMRGKHVTSALLDRVLADAAEDGYSFVEAYPAKKAEGETENYTGPLALYEKAGFTRTGETENCLILQKKIGSGRD